MIDVARMALGVVGAALIGVGGWLHYPPLGLAAAGALLVAVAVIGTYLAPR